MTKTDALRRLSSLIDLHGDAAVVGVMIGVAGSREIGVSMSSDADVLMVGVRARLATVLVLDEELRSVTPIVEAIGG